MNYYFTQLNLDTEQQEMYNVHSPNFPGCITMGDGLDEASCMAIDVLPSFIETSIEDGATLPEPSDFEMARTKSLAHNQNLDKLAQPGTLFR